MADSLTSFAPIHVGHTTYYISYLHHHTYYHSTLLLLLIIQITTTRIKIIHNNNKNGNGNGNQNNNTYVTSGNSQSFSSSFRLLTPYDFDDNNVILDSMKKKGGGF